MYRIVAFLIITEILTVEKKKQLLFKGFLSKDSERKGTVRLLHQKKVRRKGGKLFL